jgi:ATP-binding cassette subfamily G (WHITE) protein 2 (PDR)
MSSTGGIIRTESGRDTYLPDGIGYDDHAPHRVDSEALSSATSKTLNETESPSAASRPQYLTSDGKEAAEDPIDRLESRGATTGDYFEPINAGDDGILTRLASQVSRNQSYYSRRASTTGNTDLERTNTLEGLERGKDELDPSSPKFDLYKWIRYIMRAIDQDDVKMARAGITMKNVTVRGTGSALNLQKNVGSVLMAPLRFSENFSFGKKSSKTIIRDFDILMKNGEMLIVLGRPGSGCSTLLKTMTGEMHGLQVDEQSVVHYNGITQQQMMKEFKGEVVYNQEVDKHFPHLTVGETLEHAAALRAPSHRAEDISRQEFIKHITQVIMAVYGLSHTYNTKVGDDFVRGVSGGERKRVSIAEMALSGSPIAAWDNSTRGLDSATALTFTKSLRQTANLVGSSHIVAIYQASQAIYDQFDKAVVLYEGRQIFFGSTSRAKAYFEEMGWYCPPRQTTGDFLTSVTNPSERQTRDGFDKQVPRTADDFEAYWRASPDFAHLQKEIEAHEQEFPVGDQRKLEEFRASKLDSQANHTRPKSPYVVSIPMQIKLNMKRAVQRIWNDKASTFTPIIGNIIMALIVGSVFYGTPNASAGFFSKGSVLFFAVLLNALSAISEINSLYAQRPIVEKHKSYAFYHPATEVSLTT